MYDFGFPVCREVSGLGKIWHKKRVHMDLIHLALRLKHEFGIYLSLVSCPFQYFQWQQSCVKNKLLHQTSKKVQYMFI